jgi:hypothetical protein
MIIPSQSSKALLDFLDGSFIGDPADARSFCERVMNPNFLRFLAGGDRTDFECAVDKVTSFRASCKKWNVSVKFFVQEGNRISARLVGDLAVGDDPVKTMELMIMAELDEQGRFLKVWEQVAEYVGTGEE